MAGEEKQLVVEETTVVPGKMEFRLISPTESNFLKHIEWNKEELLAAVRSKVALYEGIVYTEETVKTDQCKDGCIFNRSGAVIASRALPDGTGLRNIRIFLQ